MSQKPLRSKTWWFGGLLTFGLVAASCAGSGDTTTTTARDTTTTTVEATTTTSPPPAYLGLVVDAGGCDYGGRVRSITAVDEFTVEFDLCGSHPGFLASWRRSPPVSSASSRKRIWRPRVALRCVTRSAPARTGSSTGSQATLSFSSGSTITTGTRRRRGRPSSGGRPRAPAHWSSCSPGRRMGCRSRTLRTTQRSTATPTWCCWKSPSPMCSTSASPTRSRPGATSGFARRWRSASTGSGSSTASIRLDRRRRRTSRHVRWRTGAKASRGTSSTWMKPGRCLPRPDSATGLRRRSITAM